MTYIYIGPNLKGIVRRNQIFTYKPEKIIEQTCEVNKLAGSMFIPMDKIVESKKELRSPGSFLNIAYEKIEKTSRR